MALQIGLPQIDDLDLNRAVKDRHFLETVRHGMTGKAVGLLTGLKLVERLHGIQEARYYLLGAHPGVGKTQLTDFIFVFSAWLTARTEGREIKIFYYSLELPSTVKKAKWCSSYLLWKYGIMWTSDFILGRIKKHLPSEEDYKLIQEAFSFVELLMEDMMLVDHYVTPSSIYKTLSQTYYPKYGVVTREQLTPEQQADGRVPLAVQYQKTKSVPLTLLIIDHLALLEGEKTKDTMDEMSKLGVNLRNIFGTTLIFVQQFNQDLIKSRRESITRLGPAKAVSVMSPKQLDFGDSTYTFRDADHVIGLVKPADFEVEDFQGVPCAPPSFGGLGGCLLVPYLIKNRYGPINRFYPLFMNGISGMFYDLPEVTSVAGLGSILGNDWGPWVLEASKIEKNNG